ncbi:MAG: CoA-binding protein [Actinomycetota bacterium]|nr:CoA-binding protein [Actinomycetota bacterium]
MTSYHDVLATTTSVLLVDWPSRDVPDTLARAGWTVFVKGGPQPDNYSAYQMEGDEVVSRPVGHPPEQADLVYSHRPLNELPGIVARARQLGARAVWHQSGRSEAGSKDPRGCWVPEAESEQARTLVEAAGLHYFESPYLADAVRARAERPPG